MDEIRWALTNAKNPPWRSALPHHQLQILARIKLRNSLPGQMLLPGMEPEEVACLVAWEAPLPVEETNGQDQRLARQHYELTYLRAGCGKSAHPVR